jgi:hypothetical protein
MFPNCDPCIDVSKYESLGGFSHHPVEGRTNIKKGITKKCHVATLEGSNAN